METHSSLDVNNDASATITNHSVSVNYDNTIEAGVSVGNDNASVGIDVSVKTGTVKY